MRCQTPPDALEAGVNQGQALIQTDRGPQIDPEIAYLAVMVPARAERIRRIMEQLGRTDGTMPNVRRIYGAMTGE